MSNALRCCGFFTGIATLICDVLKGTFSLMICAVLVNQMMQLFGFICVFFHCYSIYLGGKGGKGVATAGGILLFFEPIILFWASLAW